MKVWELIAELSKSKAGAEVVVRLQQTNGTEIICTDIIDDETFEICGGDAQLVDEDGNEVISLEDAVGFSFDVD